MSCISMPWQRHHCLLTPQHKVTSQSQRCRASGLATCSWSLLPHTALPSAGLWQLGRGACCGASSCRTCSSEGSSCPSGWLPQQPSGAGIR